MSPPAEGGPMPPGGVPERVEPAGPEALAAVLREADASGRSVLPVGTGTRPPVAAPGDVGGHRSAPALVLASTGCARLVAHDPGEQTVTAQAGLPLAALAAHLARHGQWLPGAGTGGTLGGWIAASPDAASDRSCGRPRDRLLGCQAALADGTLARGRGRVVKNVAGYDLPRLLAGSLGTLAVLTEATLKVEPLPAARVLLRAGFDGTDEALRTLLALHVSPLEPASLDLRAAREGGATRFELLVGLAGGTAGVAARADAAARELRQHGARGLERLDGEEGDGLRAALDDPAGPVLMRVPAPPSRLGAALERALGSLAEAGHEGVTAELVARPDPGLLLVALRTEPGAPALDTLLAALRRLGPAWLVRAPAALAARVASRGPPPPDLGLMLRIKRALDPRGTLAPGLGLAGWPAGAAGGAS